MKKINNYIQEKLVINKNLKVSNKKNEEVLVAELQRLNNVAIGYDRSLILTTLEDFNKKYIFDDVIIRVIDVQHEFYYSFYNKYTFKLHSDDRNSALRISLYNGKNNIIKSSCIKELTNIISSSKKDYLVFETNLSTIHSNYLYMWMSKENQCLEIILSNYNYENLKSKNTFK